jgi:hypothetical protein
VKSEEFRIKNYYLFYSLLLLTLNSSLQYCYNLFQNFLIPIFILVRIAIRPATGIEDNTVSIAAVPIPAIPEIAPPEVSFIR